MTAPAYRQLVWITGEAGATRARARALLHDHESHRLGWVGQPDPEASTAALPPARASVVATGGGRSLLGQTLTAGVLDAHAGFDPDDFGALSGTIIGGGHLLLLSPPPDDWRSRPDPALQPLLTHGLRLGDFAGHFLHRLTRILGQSPAVTRVEARPAATEALSPLTPPIHAALETPPEDCVPTADQQAVIDAIATLARASAPGVLFITADRGRGKSAALGLATRLLPNVPVRLTGPSRAAVARVRAHAGVAAAPSFLAPEAVSPDPSLLLIDEAAALPLGRLARLVADNPRCVLTGTVHGYEGSGRGLILRLARTLRATARAVQQQHLSEPVRWPADDPLEQLTDRILLLSAEPARSDSAPTQASVTLESVEPAALARHEADLRAAFGLLVAGHYQTRPRDLRQILDDPALQLILARAGQQIVGIAAARAEGGLDPDLTRAIHTGTRRPAGHLIAQSLTFHAGVECAATQRGLRVQRIAVHPDWQRRGIGQKLVNRLTQTTRDGGLDWLGTSFGGTAELVDFWRACGLEPVRVGNRRDPRSASHAVIMLRALSPAGTALMSMARQRLAVHLPNQLTHALADLPTALVERLSADLPTPPTEAIDQADLAAFAHGYRSLLDTHGALARRARGVDNGWDPSDWALLDTAIRAPLDTAALTATAGASGHREALKRLRRVAQQLLESDA